MFDELTLLNIQKLTPFFIYGTKLFRVVMKYKPQAQQKPQNKIKNALV